MLGLQLRHSSLLLRRNYCRPWTTNSAGSRRFISAVACSPAAIMSTGTYAPTCLAVVGDVHGQWAERDVAGLQALQPTLTVFVGDFGNEDVDIVQQVANGTPGPKVVMLGNHDAWYTMKELRGTQIKQGASSQKASWEQLEAVLPEGSHNGVLQQLDALGDSFAGYTAHQVPGSSLSIVGARPFSMGGKDFKPVAPLLTAMYPDVQGWGDSAAKVVQLASQAAGAGNTVILLNHNAPAGLGEEYCDIAGVDWKAGGGDHGDLDLRLALDQLSQDGIAVPLILCGHMHHRLKGGSNRRMVAVDVDCGTVVLNAATVPRVRSAAGAGAPTLHHFLLVNFQPDGQLSGAKDVWVRVALGADGPGWDAHIAEEQDVLRCVRGEAGCTFEFWDAHEQEWRNAFVAAQAAAPAVTAAAAPT